ncbi:T9SS type A sorting domain-containing protein [Crocinitomicaceae bacterium]|nr:T9SS type A sorting domain-containing protein [Crocinitomicaceae bacterium]MDC1384944.1 T9SS type A sorting domain-containing protein [Crocinitomicaceae bacterium]|tara:strand:- start:236 stop:514 length:279 start_codon:yes stop_codon:yes gene_type:complete
MNCILLSVFFSSSETLGRRSVIRLIAISGIVTDKVTVIITEARGKVIMTQEFTNVSESMELPVHLNSMEAGVYFVTITANDSKSVQRIVVTK